MRGSEESRRLIVRRNRVLDMRGKRLGSRGGKVSRLALHISEEKQDTLQYLGLLQLTGDRRCKIKSSVRLAGLESLPVFVCCATYLICSDIGLLSV